MKAIGNRIGRMTLAGCFSALAAAAPLGVLMSLQHRADLSSLGFGLFLGAGLAGFLAAFEHLWTGRPGSFVPQALAAAVAGAAGGGAAAAAGQRLFQAWGGFLVQTTRPGISVPLSAGAAAAWCLTGLFVGLAVTVPFPAQRARWAGSAGGGALGGLVGGLAVQLVRPLLGTGSMVLGLVILGGAMALGISWFERSLAGAAIQILEGPGKGSALPLFHDFVIGADRRCPLSLTGAGIASRHARIFIRKGVPFLQDLSSGPGLTLNERRVSSASARLEHGDLIRIGPCLLRLYRPQATAGRLVAAVLAALALAALSSPARADEGPVSPRISQVDLSAFPTVDVYAVIPPSLNLGRIRDLRVSEGGGEATVLEVRDLSRGERDVPLSISLVLDLSESMAGTKLAKAREALSSLSRTLPPSASINLVVFSDRVTTAAVAVPAAALPDLTEEMTASGHTALFDAIQTGVRLLEGVPGRRAVLTLTDGMANRGRVSLESATETARLGGVSLLFVGLGDDARRNRLEFMATQTGGEAVFTSDPDSLGELFDGFAEELTGELMVRYRSLGQDTAVVPLTLNLATRDGDLVLEGRFLSPRAAFFGTAGKASISLLALGVLGLAGLAAVSRLTAFQACRSHLLLVEGSTSATRILGRALKESGMTVPVSLGGKTLLVNNQPASGTRVLKAGDTLTWGSTTILYRKN